VLFSARFIAGHLMFEIRPRVVANGLAPGAVEDFVELNSQFA
jgi:hypothetical protein